MLEGHELDAFQTRRLLTGVFNRLGDGKSDPLTCEPPAWVTPCKVASAKAELALARAEFERGVGQRGRE